MLKATEGARSVHVGGSGGSGADDNDDREGIGELFSRAVTEGKAYASAEVNVYKQMALAKADEGKLAGIYIGAGAVLALCGLIAFFVEVAEWFSDSLDLGPLLGGVITLAIAGLIGFVLIKMGTSHLAKMSQAGKGGA